MLDVELVGADGSAARTGSRRPSAETRFMVTPVLGNPFRREVIVDTGDRYEKGLLWFEPHAALSVRLDTASTSKRLIRQRSGAAQTPLFQAYLRWSRFPFFVIDRPPAVALVSISTTIGTRPRRMGGRLGWSVDLRH